MKRDWSEADIRLGGVSLKEILTQLTDWVENKAQEIPFKADESETFRREWDFKVAEQTAHLEIEARISAKNKGG